jgi:hypothetical protein
VIKIWCIRSSLLFQTQVETKKKLKIYYCFGIVLDPWSFIGFPNGLITGRFVLKVQLSVGNRKTSTDAVCLEYVHVVCSVAN